jgi:hypothetical protein
MRKLSHFQQQGRLIDQAKPAPIKTGAKLSTCKSNQELHATRYKALRHNAALCFNKKLTRNFRVHEKAGERKIEKEWRSLRCIEPVEKAELVSMQATLNGS